VLDTGVEVTHADFGGRAYIGANFISGEVATDLNGHGTNVAGIAAGNLFGVAKLANIISVKVLNQEASGTYSSIISGIQYVQQYVVPGSTVIVLSVSGGISVSVNQALTAAFQAGVAIFGAAGNGYTDACTTTPGSANGVMVVGATDDNDNMATFSNYGACVDMYAPGVSIRSDYYVAGSTTATAYLSGTSQATPHVAGIAACYMADYSFQAPQTLYNYLAYYGTWNLIQGLGPSSTNVLAYNGLDNYM